MYKSILFFQHISHCYENGEFTLPHITVDEMKQLVENKIVSFGFPRFSSKFFTRSIPKLERWKNS
ncbi:zinc ribbon domain-containing protein [Bacillus cereus]|uniref:zinc ribbon domain-containing protein n=1 Tax=Bacillus cereus TaxID=1396 RepID=UPI00396F69B6